MELYPVEFRFSENSTFLIWKGNDDVLNDSFWEDGNKVLAFSDFLQMQSYSHKKNLTLLGEPIVYDIQGLRDWFNSKNSINSEDANNILNAWNIFIDLAETPSLKTTFFKDECIGGVHHKLTLMSSAGGCLAGGEESQELSYDDVSSVRRVMAKGFDLIDSI